MFQEKPQAFLALPLKDPAAVNLATQIREVLQEQGIESVLPTDFESGGLVSDQIHVAIRQAEVVVADDGPGVPPADRERIFRRFVTTRPGGNGLGLATSRDIAQAHGGSLSLREGEGATFVLTLPPA